MPVEDALYNATYNITNAARRAFNFVASPFAAARKAIKAGFNRATGTTALRKRGLERQRKILPGFLGYLLAGETFALTAFALAPLAGPLAPAFAAVTLPIAILPSRIQAAYIIGKDNHKKKIAAQNQLPAKSI